MTKKIDPSTSAHAAGENTRTGSIDRRGFFRGAALLTVGSLGATGAVAQTAGQQGAVTDASSAELQARILRAQRWAGPAPSDWVRPRAGVDHNVVILGGGQSGLAIAYGLKRLGVGSVEIIDRGEPGRTGIWRTIARMQQLRTPKTMPGLEQDNPMLSVRGWYETLHGPDAFDNLDRIPRLAWADYLDWYQQVTEPNVRYRTELVEIEPQGDVLRLHLDVEGVRRVETTRKLVLANGYAGAGGANVPGFLRALPTEFWAHTSSPIDFDAMSGKTVAVVGAGSSAFDAAAVALEHGAAEVHMFNRRAYVDYPGGARSTGPSDRGHANVLKMTYELPDEVRWRNFLAGDRRVASVPPDSLQRAVAFDGFTLHLESSLTDVEIARGKVAAKANGESFRFDHVISGTGYRIDLSAQPELANVQAAIARWGDRYEPESGEDSQAGAAHPYLGAGFQFLPRDGVEAPYLRNIHCFNLSAALSFGKPVGDIPSCADHPRIVEAIARDLYVESVDAEAHRRFIDAPTLPADPAPYEKALRRSRRAA